MNKECPCGRRARRYSDCPSLDCFREHFHDPDPEPTQPERNLKEMG